MQVASSVCVCWIDIHEKVSRCWPEVCREVSASCTTFENLSVYCVLRWSEMGKYRFCCKQTSFSIDLGHASEQRLAGLDSLGKISPPYAQAPLTCHPSPHETRMDGWMWNSKWEGRDVNMCMFDFDVSFLRSWAERVNMRILRSPTRPTTGLTFALVSENVEENE